MNEYYVYEWYRIASNRVFHVGKGKGQRMYDVKNHRNRYFLNVLSSEPCAVRIYKDNLTEQEAWDLERIHITELKQLGQCETNLHEGGCGGYTGNYDSPERNKKLSDFMKKEGRWRGEKKSSLS